MAIQHKDITDPNIHEPKGVNVAANKTVYVADGSGTGAWALIDATNIDGLTASAVAGQKIISNGSDGFSYVRDAAYGSMVMNNNLTGFALTGALDPELSTNQGYTTLTGTGSPWASSNLYGVTFSTDRLIVPVTGMYELSAEMRITQFPTSTSRVGVRYLIDGATYSTRRSTHKGAGVGDEGKIIITEHVQLTAASYIQLAVASSGSGDIVFNDVTVNLKLIRQTA